MACPSRNVEFGAWTQEEYENLFEGQYTNMNVISGYVGSTAIPVPTVAPPAQPYSEDTYTDSQPNEEFVPNTQVQPYIPDINFPVVSSGGSTTPAPSVSGPAIRTEAPVPTEAPITTEAPVPKPQVPQPEVPAARPAEPQHRSTPPPNKKKKLTSPVWDDFHISYTQSGDGTTKR